jgi:Family of unknown function (DUF5999)
MRTISLLTPLDDTGLHRRQPVALCTHSPACPAADSADREAAAVVAAHPEQGWCVNCTFLRSLGTAMSDCPRSSV